MREEVRECLRLIASRQLQRQYQAKVPIADVRNELICTWFDDLYHPNSVLFQQTFNTDERDALAEFNRAYEDRLPDLPATIQELHASGVWEEVRASASAALSKLGLGEHQSGDGNDVAR